MNKFFPRASALLALLPCSLRRFTDPGFHFHDTVPGEMFVSSSGSLYKRGQTAIDSTDIPTSCVIDAVIDAGGLQGIEFKEHVTRFMNSKVSHKEALSNWTLGVAGEAGEVVELVKKHLYHGKELDRDRVKEEIGGVLWYLQALCIQTGVELHECMAYNQEQLEKRHQGQAFDITKVDNGKGGETPPVSPAAVVCVGPPLHQYNPDPNRGFHGYSARCA